MFSHKSHINVSLALRLDGVKCGGRQWRTPYIDWVQGPVAAAEMCCKGLQRLHL